MQAKGQIPGAAKSLPVELRLLALALPARIEIRVQIEDDEVGIVEYRALQVLFRAGELSTASPRVWRRIHPGKPGVQLEATHLGQEEQSREILADQVFAIAVVVAGINGDGARERRGRSQCFW